VDLFVLQGNEYRKMPFRVPRTKYCDMAKSNKKFHEDIAAVSNFPPTVGCPVLPKVIYLFPVVSASIVLFFFLPVFRITILLPIIISMCQVFQKILMENLNVVLCSIIYNGQLILEFCMLNYEIMIRVFYFIKNYFGAWVLML
jgi:hypothetical protein